MIFDCFTFFNELDLLELRLNTLNEVVDKFVLVEATRNFNNKEKPLYFNVNKERFKKFKDKIIHIIVDEFPSEDEIEEWTIENYQRNQISKGLENCKDDDIILISDLDEIPRPELIKEKYNPDKIIAFDCDVFTYFLNNYTVGYNWTHGTKMLSYKNFKSLLDDEDFSKTYAIAPPYNIGTNPNTIRLYYGKKQEHVFRGGWHLSYIGTKKDILNKYHSTSDGNPELSEKECLKLINSNKFLNTYYLVPVEIDKTFPKYIQENKEKYKDFIITDYKYNINSKKLQLTYAVRYFLDNIFAIKDEIKGKTKRKKIIILGLKMSFKIKQNKRSTNAI